MSLQVTDSSLQSSEQYIIRAKRQEQTEQLKKTQEQQVQQAQQAEQVDTYDKENPAGEEVEGIYSVSHDESGNLKIDYKQPSESKGIKTEASKEAAGVAPSTESASSGTDNDDEIEELEKQRSQLQQRLSREQDESVKAQLRNQIQAVEAQIIQLKTAAQSL